jgi:hypothetical protein
LKKSAYHLIIGFFIIFSLISVIITKEFTVTSNIQSIEESIEGFLSTKNINGLINIHKVTDIDNKKLVVFELNNNIGEAEFIRGINGKYKILSTGYGTNFIRRRILKTNKARYLTIIGRNYNKKIKRIDLVLENNNYTFSIPVEDEYFIYHKMITDDSMNMMLDKIILIDKQGNDITDKIYTKYKMR